MSRIRAQKLKILLLADEARLARREVEIRAEPLVRDTRLATSLFQRSKTLIRLLGRNGPKQPKRLYPAIATAFTLSFLLPSIIKMFRSRSNHHNNSQRK